MKRRKQQDILFKSPGLSQQEEKQLQQRLKTVQENLELIGSVSHMIIWLFLAGCEKELWS